MRKIVVVSVLTILSIFIITSVIINKFNYQEPIATRKYFLAKSYWKKGYPFLVPFTKGTEIDLVVLAFFPSFQEIFLKNGSSWIKISPTTKIYEDITFKITN